MPSLLLPEQEQDLLTHTEPIHHSRNTHLLRAERQPKSTTSLPLLLTNSTFVMAEPQPPNPGAPNNTEPPPRLTRQSTATRQPSALEQAKADANQARKEANTERFTNRQRQILGLGSGIEPFYPSSYPPSLKQPTFAPTSRPEYTIHGGLGVVSQSQTIGETQDDHLQPQLPTPKKTNELYDDGQESTDDEQDEPQQDEATIDFTEAYSRLTSDEKNDLGLDPDIVKDHLKAANYHNFLQAVKAEPKFWFAEVRHLATQHQKIKHKYTKLQPVYNRLKVSHEGRQNKVRELREELDSMPTKEEMRDALKDAEDEGYQRALDEAQPGITNLQEELDSANAEKEALESDKALLEMQLRDLRDANQVPLAPPVRRNAADLFRRNNREPSAVPSSAPLTQPLATTTKPDVDPRWPNPPTYSGLDCKDVEYRIWKSKCQSKVEASYPHFPEQRKIRSIQVFTTGQAWQTIENGITNAAWASIDDMWNDLDSQYGSAFDQANAKMQLHNLHMTVGEKPSAFLVKYQDVATRAGVQYDAQDLWMKLTPTFKNKVSSGLPYNAFVAELRSKERDHYAMIEMHPRDKPASSVNQTPRNNGSRPPAIAPRSITGHTTAGNTGASGATYANRASRGPIVRVIPFKYKDLPSVKTNPGLLPQLLAEHKCIRCRDGEHPRPEDCIFHPSRGNFRFGNVTHETRLDNPSLNAITTYQQSNAHDRHSHATQAASPLLALPQYPGQGNDGQGNATSHS